MKHASELIKGFESEQYNELLTDIYVDEHLLAYQNGRYIAALQEFIKDSDKTVQQVVTEAVAKIGEKIDIRRYTRYELGEGLEKRNDDFVSEVMAQAK